MQEAEDKEIAGQNRIPLAGSLGERLNRCIPGATRTKAGIQRGSRYSSERIFFRRFLASVQTGCELARTKDLIMSGLATWPEKSRG